MKTQVHIVDEEDDGIRLDRWVKRRLPDISFLMLAKWARLGSVRISGKRCEPSDRVSTGDEIKLPLYEAPVDEAAPQIWATKKPLSELEIAEAQEMVIHKDKDALILNKPPGLATQGGTGTLKHVDGMLDALMFERPDRPRLVHRLDKDTSGVLLLGRSAKAAAAFSEHFRDRTATKIYWALVMGCPSANEGMIVAPIGKQPGTGGEKMMVDEKEGQSARTKFRVIDRAGNRAAWLELQPLTGRTHQLRVHCAAIGHPIVGDGKYGGKDAFLTGGVSRKMHLHARRLIMPRGEGLKPLDVTAKFPQHMSDSWDMIGFDEKEGNLSASAIAAQMEIKAARPKKLSPAAQQEQEQEEAVKRGRLAARNTRRGARRTVTKRGTKTVKKSPPRRP